MERLSSPEFLTPVEHATAVAEELDRLSATLNPGLQRLTGAQLTRRENAITKGLYDCDIWGALSDCSVDTEAVEVILGALDRLEVAGGNESRLLWTLNLDRINDPFFIRGALRKLYRDNSKPLEALLTRAIEGTDSDELLPLVTLVEAITYREAGPASEWRQQGRVKDPESLPGKLASTPGFELALLQGQANSLQTRQANAASIYHDRTMRQTTYLLNTLGVDQQALALFNDAVRMQHSKVDQHGKLIPLREGGGPDIAAWYDTMARYTQNFVHVGRERASALYEHFGIVCLPRYTPAQLDRLCRVLSGDIAFLGHDVTIVATDVRGDKDGGAFPGHIAAYEHGNVVPIEFNGLKELYVRPIRLAKWLGLRSSTLVAIYHGNDGHAQSGDGITAEHLKVHGIEGEDFNDEEEAPEEPEETAADVTPATPANVYDVEEVPLAAFIDVAMQPHSKTGYVHLVMSSCRQAKPMYKRELSMADAILHCTRPDQHVMVTATDVDTSVERDELGVRYFDGQNNWAGVPARNFTLDSNGQTNVGMSVAIPGVK